MHHRENMTFRKPCYFPYVFFIKQRQARNDNQNITLILIRTFLTKSSLVAISAQTFGQRIACTFATRSPVQTNQVVYVTNSSVRFWEHQYRLTIVLWMFSRWLKPFNFNFIPLIFACSIIRPLVQCLNG